MASDSEPRKFFGAPPILRSRQKSYFGEKNLGTAILVHSNTDCNKAFIKSSAHHNFRGGGFSRTPCTLSKHVSRGTSDLSGELGPLGPSCNSITGMGERHELLQQGLRHFRAF